MKKSMFSWILDKTRVIAKNRLRRALIWQNICICGAYMADLDLQELEVYEELRNNG